MGEVPAKTSDSSGSGEERFGAKPSDVAAAIGKASQAEVDKNAAGLLAAGERQDADTAKRTVR